ncbi:hypothetical protein L208DRAFT_308812 [Tricholoma matsutake]|nr:hypothetical protein L208DRAFT_308812 [Tricholoma matsutake 945]
MSAFYGSQPLGLGIACGAILGAALLASTRKSRFLVATNHRKQRNASSRGFLDISSFSGVLDMICHYRRPLERHLNRSTRSMPIVALAPPPNSPKSSLLFEGGTFDEPEPAYLLPKYPMSPLSIQLSSFEFYPSKEERSGVLTESDLGLTNDATMHDELELARQDVPAVIRRFSATLTISNGGVEDRLVATLSQLKQKASNERSSITLLVEFKGNASSADRITQEIIDNMDEYLKCLAVYTPTDVDDHTGSIPSVKLSQCLAPPAQSSVFQHLVWKGNVITDLFSQWGSASNIQFGTLRTMNLTCDLSLDDCIQILFECESVTDFSAQSLTEVASFMKHDFYDKDIPHLKSLTIKSDVMLDKLFNTLNMTQLKSIDFELGVDASPSIGVASLAIPWNTLQNVRLVGVPNKVHSDHVRQQCTIARVLHLETLHDV